MCSCANEIGPGLPTLPSPLDGIIVNDPDVMSAPPKFSITLRPSTDSDSPEVMSAPVKPSMARRRPSDSLASTSPSVRAPVAPSSACTVMSLRARNSAAPAMSLARPWRPSGALRDGQRVLLAALTVAKKLGDQSLHGDCLIQLGHVNQRFIEPLEALGHASEALAVFTRIGDRARQGEAHSLLGGIYYRLGDLKQANENLERAMEIQVALSDCFTV